ncbi:autotransporter assembly complex protein TamA [Noviherbaspirillum humi]|nr:autotransporter assembly complex family protein [Noviherbaspirillum humi]
MKQNPPKSPIDRIYAGACKRMALRCLLSLAACLPLTAMAESDNRFDVQIEGAGDYRKLLEDYLEIRRHQTDDALSEEELQRLVNITPAQIRELLATEGFFSPTIRHELLRDGGRPVARFIVEPGEPTRVGNVDIRFSGDIAGGRHAQRMAALRRQWSLDAGDVFKQSAWSGAKGNLLKNLLNRDYPSAAIKESEARVDPERRIADLSVEVDSGPAFTFGTLQVQGLQRYSREMIDELNPIRPGEPYSQDKLNELQARLQDSGYFKSAFASTEVDPDHPNDVPVRVDVSENERRRLALGLGFSTDAGARVEARWLDRRFLDRNWRLESQLLFDRDTRRLAGTVFFPTWRNGWHPNLDARYERTNISGELNDKIRVGGRLTKPIQTDERILGVTYYADRQRVGDTFINNRQALLANAGYTWRRVDNLLSPRRGYLASVDVGAGPAGVINQANIGRVLASGVWMTMLNRTWQPILRAQVGQVFGASRFDVPADLLFRAGGDQSVRGYALNTLGVPQDGAIVGGRVLAVASAELVYWFKPDWGAAVFTDVGGAADSWRDFSAGHGTGIGGRWRSPIGPVSVDVAYNHETRQPRLHFTVGYGF